MPTPRATGPADLPAASPAPAAPSLPLRLMLKFTPDAFERRFGEHYLAFYHRYAQAALLLGLVLVIGDFMVDWLATPGLASNWLRLQVAVPILAVGFGYTLLKQARQHWQPVLGGFIVALAAGLFWILLRIDAEGGRGLTSWVGILNFTFLQFYCFVVLGVQFRIALLAGLAILALFEATLWAQPHALAAQAAYWSYHVVTLFILAAGIGWWREFIVRKDFAAQCALEDARLAAERLARAKSAFLATMSHEIRTPLNGVIGMNALMLDSGLSAQQRAWAEAAQVSSRHLLALIDDVLDASKIEAEGLTMEAVDFDLRQVIEEARLMFALAAQARGLTLQTALEPPHVEPLLRGDPLRLRQIVANLVGNAIKFTEHGGITVHARIAPAGNGHADVRIAVTDTGIGIADKAQALIFDTFAQADSSTTRRYGGSGLGLSISRELAVRMGGDIRVDSAPGRGACFTVEVRLPLGEARTDAAAVAASQPPRRLRGHVLLVEDHPINRSVATGVLDQLGLTWRVAEHGADAVEQVRHHAFDAVLMDCQMPVMDGFEATAAIRALPQGRGAALPIVALTANAGEEDARRCREAGMNGFLTKPFTRETLAGALAPWLQDASDAESAEAASAAPAIAAAPMQAQRQGPDETPVIDHHTIARLRGLDTDGGLLREVLSGFLRWADEELSEMEKAVAERHVEALGRTAHMLKSTTSNVGASALSQRYAAMGRRACVGDLDDVDAQLDAIRLEHARVKRALADLLHAYA